MEFFSSYTGNNRRGGWTNSILPTSITKSKLPRKSRRRTSLLDFFFSNFFCIGISISFLFFLAIIIRYGIPNPLSSHPKSRNTSFSRFRKPNYRKPVIVSSNGSNVVPSAAVVDITTKDLYDKIDFLDVDGGPWKQGWRVNYKGDEWDNEKLKIIVVPHSHNDPGWKLTVEQYYNQQSRHILDTIVDSLSKVINDHNSSV